MANMCVAAATFFPNPIIMTSQDKEVKNNLLDCENLQAGVVSTTAVGVLRMILYVYCL